ncbi:hypothetical protein ScPMuIL_000536 [Solemya velum]
MELFACFGICSERYLFIRGLVQQEKWQRTRHYLKSAAECTSRAIVSLELSEKPVRTVKQGRSLEGIGGETMKKLKHIYESKKYSSLPPTTGVYCSSAGAILVALLEATEEAICEGHSQDWSVLVSEADLKSRVEAKCEEAFLPDNSEGICQAWLRIEILIRRDLVKRRSLRKSPVYHLLPIGREVASRLKGLRGRDVVRPTPATPSLPVDVPWLVDFREAGPQDALYSNDNGSDGVVLLVDIREWGGDRLGLGQLCELLDRSGVTYKTFHLASGDYMWIWRRDGQQRLLPHMVERKRADDIASSLKDGRFWKQINKMKEWKSQFEKCGVPCGLQYVVEGEPEKYVVRCADGCQGVGKCGNPTLTQVQVCIESVLSCVNTVVLFGTWPATPDLDLQRTDGIESTVLLLASITIELNHRTNKGDFDVLAAREMTALQHRVTFPDNRTRHNIHITRPTGDKQAVGAVGPKQARRNVGSKQPRLSKGHKQTNGTTKRKKTRRIKTITPQSKSIIAEDIVPGTSDFAGGPVVLSDEDTYNRKLITPVRGATQSRATIDVRELVTRGLVQTVFV